MEYQFSFDKKRLIAIFLGMFLIGILTFSCGLVTGLGLGIPIQAKIAARNKSLTDEKVGMAKNAVKDLKDLKAPEAPKLPEVPKLPEGLPLTLPAASASAAKPAPAATSPAAPVVAEAALPGAAPASGASAPGPDSQPYILQVGAFRDQKYAKQLQADLTKKGYSTVIFNLVDKEDGKTWHLVRMGGYKNMDAAASAASNFIGKEGIPAFIRRADSL
jgi:hypothetical protein